MDNDGDESKKEFSDNAMEEEQAQGAYKAVAATKNDDDDRARVPKESRRERERERERLGEKERSGATRKLLKSAHHAKREAERERKQGEKTDAKTSVFLTAHT